MKKILKLVLGLLLVGGMVFGANPSESLVISVTVPAMAVLKIHNASVNTISEFNSVTTATGHTFTITGYETANAPTTETATFYALIKTNAKTATTLKATFANMTGATPGNASQISYNFKLGEGTETPSTDTQKTVSQTISAVIGATVVPTIFTIKLKDTGTDSIQSATIDSYSATIMFEYTTI